MKVVFIILLISCIIVSCGIYGHPNDTFIEELTVSIRDFKNIPQTLDPQINFRIKEKLENKFRQDYHWRVVDNNGGLKIQGSITDYKIETIGIDSKSAALINRIIVTINCQTSTIYNSRGNSYDKFVEFVDYDAKKDLGEVRDSLNNLLINKMVDQLFYKINFTW